MTLNGTRPIQPGRVSIMTRRARFLAVTVVAILSILLVGYVAALPKLESGQLGVGTAIAAQIGCAEPPQGMNRTHQAGMADLAMTAQHGQGNYRLTNLL